MFDREKEVVELNEWSEIEKEIRLEKPQKLILSISLYEYEEREIEVAAALIQIGGCSWSIFKSNPLKPVISAGV